VNRLVGDDINSVFEGEWEALDHSSSTALFSVSFMEAFALALLVVQILLAVKAWKQGWKVWPILILVVKFPFAFTIAFVAGISGALIGYNAQELHMLGFCISLCIESGVIAALWYMKEHPRKVTVYEIPEEQIELIEDASGYLEEVEEEKTCE